MRWQGNSALTGAACVEYAWAAGRHRVFSERQVLHCQVKSSERPSEPACWQSTAAHWSLNTTPPEGLRSSVAAPLIALLDANLVHLCWVQEERSEPGSVKGCRPVATGEHWAGCMRVQYTSTRGKCHNSPPCGQRPTLSCLQNSLQKLNQPDLPAPALITGTDSKQCARPQAQLQSPHRPECQVRCKSSTRSSCASLARKQQFRVQNVLHYGAGVRQGARCPISVVIPRRPANQSLSWCKRAGVCASCLCLSTNAWVTAPERRRLKDMSQVSHDKCVLPHLDLSCAARDVSVCFVNRVVNPVAARANLRTPISAWHEHRSLFVLTSPCMWWPAVRLERFLLFASWCANACVASFPDDLARPLQLCARCFSCTPWRNCANSLLGFCRPWSAVVRDGEHAMTALATMAHSGSWTQSLTQAAPEATVLQQPIRKVRPYSNCLTPCRAAQSPPVKARGRFRANTLHQLAAAPCARRFCSQQRACRWHELAEISRVCASCRMS